jgi:hypothetical protein
VTAGLARDGALASGGNGVPPVNAGLKVIFFSRFVNDHLLRLLPAKPQNRRIPNRRISKESEPAIRLYRLSVRGRLTGTVRPT